MRRAQLEAAQAELLIELARESGDDPIDLRAGRQRSRLGDEVQLRGVPCVGRGVQGALKGSVPGRNLK